MWNIRNVADLETSESVYTHYIIVVHMCFCRSLSFHFIITHQFISVFCSFSSRHIGFFYLFVCLFKFSLHPFMIVLIALIFLHHHRHAHHNLHHHGSLHRSSLNPVELVFPPPFLSVFCRAPVTPSGVTRTVSDSRRTCYLVTRL